MVPAANEPAAPPISERATHRTTAAAVLSWRRIRVTPCAGVAIRALISPPGRSRNLGGRDTIIALGKH